MVKSDFELIPGAVDVQRLLVPVVGVEASHVSQIREQFGEVRRGTPKVRFYAVRRGRTPGLYHSWPDCSREVTSFSGVEHKSFGTLSTAEEYLFQSSRL